MLEWLEALLEGGVHTWGKSMVSQLVVMMVKREGPMEVGKAKSYLRSQGEPQVQGQRAWITTRAVALSKGK